MFVATCVCVPVLQVQLQLDRVEKQLSMKDHTAVDIAKLGPQKAARAMVATYAHQCERDAWAWEARARAIAGSCAGSLPSAKSGMRAWVGFFRDVLGRRGEPFPPAVDDLLAWSRLFRQPKTFGNYLNYVRLACELAGASTAVFGHPSLKRTRNAIAKRRLCVVREPQFIRQEMVAKCLGLLERKPHLERLVYLCLTAYVFLLRVPSEAIPIAAHGHTGGKVEVWLPKRKNRLVPSSVLRACWCSR